VIVSRRSFMQIGGLALAGLPFAASAAESVEIRMIGDALGSTVRFAPRGLHVAPGTTVRWRNDDAGNAHTTTAFHPSNDSHPLRIPAGARPWNSDYLLKDETFAVTLAIPGVYDYFCIPHEMAGMVGRIVVAAAGAPAPKAAAGMEDMFPAVADILRLGQVDP
jgi:plastocyanin